MFHSEIKGLRKQQGSMLILGIFILTVMFLLAATLINIAENEDAAINQEVLGARALFAANSGADAALAKLFPLDSSSAVCSLSDKWQSPSSAETIANCEDVDRTCTQFVSGTGVDQIIQYRITSKAVCGRGEYRVSRQVEVIARAE